jgi:hypothetical protein
MTSTVVGICKTIATVRGHQVVGLLLTTIPVAERMLLYQFATAAWLMLPNRGLPNPRSLFARCPEFPAN